MFNKKYKNKIIELEKEISQLKTNDLLISKHQALVDEICLYSAQLKKIKQEISDCSEQIEFQNVNIYNPSFVFNDHTIYKQLIIENINKQKKMIKENKAIIIPHKNSVGFNGNKTQGNNIVKILSKLSLSAFNSCCNESIDKSNPFCYNKYETFIIKKFNDLNKMTQILGIYLSKEYLNLKIEQLKLTIDKKIKLEQEKEDRRQQQEILREQQKLEQEVSKQKEQLKKERKKYEIEMLKSQNENSLFLREKIDEINQQIANNDYRLNNNQAGWLYCISNADMRDNYVKLGVTRRLNPQERIDELGNASHAYKFNVHGMVFSDNVFALETKIHQYFNLQKVNQANPRKEFFELTIEQIEKAFKEFGYDVKLDPYPINEQYLLSEKMKGNALY